MNEISGVLDNNELERLTIVDCELSNTDLRFLQNNTSLISLIINKQQLTSLNGIQNTNIEYLDVSSNTIKDFKFENNHINTINASNNNIIDISNQFNGYSQLKHLWLHKNQIHTIEHLPDSIETLSIEYNPVTMIRNIDNLTNIKYIYIDKNP